MIKIEIEIKEQDESLTNSDIYLSFENYTENETLVALEYLRKIDNKTIDIDSLQKLLSI